MVCGSSQQRGATLQTDFFLVPPENIEKGRRCSAVRTMAGSRGLHQVVGVAPFVLKARSLACFCEVCRLMEYDHCHNSRYVDAFKVFELRQLKPLN